MKETPAAVRQAALEVHATIYSGEAGHVADGVVEAIEYAYTAGSQARELPAPPAIWNYSDGVDFAFAPVEKRGPIFLVTTRGRVPGRWHVCRNHEGGWNGWLITGQNVPPYLHRGETAADVIAEIFATYP